MKSTFTLLLSCLFPLGVLSQTSVTLDEVILSETEKKSVIDPEKASTNTLDLVDAIYNRVSGAQIKSDYNWTST